MKTLATLSLWFVLGWFQPAASNQEKSAESSPPTSETKTHLRVSVRDGDLRFELHPDGKVELTVPEKDKATGKKEEKTYKADSLEDFKSRYPELAKEHRIERFIPRIEWSRLDRSSQDAWRDWKKWFEEDWFWDRGRDFGKWFRDWWTPFQSDDLDNWVEEQRKLFERFRELRAPRDPSDSSDAENPTAGPAFGMRLAGVGETVAAHLGLKAGEGALVVDVREGSPAHKAGLLKHDVLLSLNGKGITDRGAFRKQIRDLAGKEFELEIVRRGQKQTLKVKGDMK